MQTRKAHPGMHLENYDQCGAAAGVLPGLHVQQALARPPAAVQTLAELMTQH